MITATIIIDARTASWMMEQVSEQGLSCHLQMGFPMGEPGHRVCKVTLEYPDDCDYEATNLLVAASERASYYVAQPYVFPKPNKKELSHEIHGR